MDLNELPSGPGFGSYNHGRTLKVNIAQPSKFGTGAEGPAGDRASELQSWCNGITERLTGSVWTTEEWLQANTKDMDASKEKLAEEKTEEKTETGPEGEEVAATED